MLMKNGLNGLGMQEINAMMSQISSNMIIALLINGLPWVSVAGVNDRGFEVVENALFRIYLENYKGVREVSGVTGNLWSIIDQPSNGNLISLTVYFVNLLVSFMIFRQDKPLTHRLLLTLYSTSTLLQLLSPYPQTAFFTPLSFIALSLMNFSNLTPRVTL
jgi:hypothetical protein